MPELAKRLVFMPSPMAKVVRNTKNGEKPLKGAIYWVVFYYNLQ